MNNKIGKEIKKIGVKTLSGVGLKDRIIEPPSKEQNTPLVYFALMSNTENINSIENLLIYVFLSSLFKYTTL